MKASPYDWRPSANDFEGERHTLIVTHENQIYSKSQSWHDNRRSHWVEQLSGRIPKQPSGVYRSGQERESERFYSVAKLKSVIWYRCDLGLVTNPSWAVISAGIECGW